MSTFLTVVVVLISIAGAVTIVVEDPDQPATLHLPKLREQAARLVRDAQDRAHRRPAPATGPRPPGDRPPPPPPRPAGYAGSGAPTVPMRQGGWTGAPASTTAGASSGPATAEMPRFTDGWRPSRPIPTWVRVRSGLALTLLLTVIGTLIAATLAGVVVFLALALKSAVS